MLLTCANTAVCFISQQLTTGLFNERTDILIVLRLFTCKGEDSKAKEISVELKLRVFFFFFFFLFFVFCFVFFFLFISL